MLYIVIFFLLVSIYLYCLLGGADFGAGVLELTASKKSKHRVRELITNAIAPIWEANHMWLIIAVVILFNGFPRIYTTISIALYIPLILLLLGIVFRGTAFTFRHYDAIKDNSQEIYSKVFSYSSLIVIFFFGLIVGAIVSNKIMLSPANFFEGYIYPWFNLFSIAVGLFITALFSFMASVYLISGRIDEEVKKEFITKTKIANVITVQLGGIVFVASYIEDVKFAQLFLSNPLSLILIGLSTLLLPLIWRTMNKGNGWNLRIMAGTQLLLIVGAFYAVYFPTIVVIRDAEDLTLINSAAPEITLTYLGWALIVGSLLIFPALFFLYKIFKSQKESKEGYSA